MCNCFALIFKYLGRIKMGCQRGLGASNAETEAFKQPVLSPHPCQVHTYKVDAFWSKKTFKTGITTQIQFFTAQHVDLPQPSYFGDLSREILEDSLYRSAGYY